jgi:hypothetical protein
MRQSLFWQSVIDTSKEIVLSQRDVYQEALSFGALFPALLASAEALRVINRLKAKKFASCFLHRAIRVRRRRSRSAAVLFQHPTRLNEQAAIGRLV